MRNLFRWTVVFSDGTKTDVKGARGQNSAAREACRRHRRFDVVEVRKHVANAPASEFLYRRWSAR